MVIAKTKNELNQNRLGIKDLGFIPTMGALHKGHISLIKKAVEENSQIVVSIFVNPTQFNNNDDFAKYPRETEKDIEKLGTILRDTDIIFTPGYEEVYYKNPSIDLDFGYLENIMEGEFRPGHFKGVAKVVSLLFDIVEADKAYFGEKDFQQLKIILELEKRRGNKTHIIPCPTMREEDGLAMSSRNKLLTKEQRKSATKIYRGLNDLQINFLNKENLDKIKSDYTSFINEDKNLKVEYIIIADSEKLKISDNYDGIHGGRAFTAVYCGEVRLIDNIKLN